MDAAPLAVYRSRRFHVPEPDDMPVSHDLRRFYIDGRWIRETGREAFAIVNPATEEAIGEIDLATTADVDAAVDAARRAFPGYAASSRADRLALLERALAAYQARHSEIAAAISDEMGAPVSLARGSQAGIGVGHLKTMIRILRDFPFEEQQGGTRLLLEAAGVCGLITPWNWPINQIACKVVPALAAGCTMVLKPSEYAPLSAALWTEVMHEAGVPPGVFNLVYGDGATAGAALSGHAGIDLVSFTGSTRAGVEVARNAAPTVKRVHQELGGKSPSLILDDADLPQAVRRSVRHVFQNSGQSCNAPTRLIVPRRRLDAVESLALASTLEIRVGDPRDPATNMGPLVSRVQYERVQAYIEKGISEGARLITGGAGRPDGLARGYYARPTIFSDVRNDMTIAREEIFGPVLSIIPCDSEAEAVRIAEDTPYGLAAYIWTADPARALRVARQIRAGAVQVNGADLSLDGPFGGFKRSGNGREWGVHGLREFCELKAVVGA